MRLPRAIEAWFTQKLFHDPNRSSSDLLVMLIHGGLRLREGYMTNHYQSLKSLIGKRSVEAYNNYIVCLNDTFGPEYVEHLESWLVTDGILMQSLVSPLQI